VFGTGLFQASQKENQGPGLGLFWHDSQYAI